MFLLAAVCFCVLLFRAEWSGVRGFTPAQETSLKRDILSQYDKSVRPLQQTTVTLSLVPTALNDIKIKEETMSISGWWVFSWTDNRLRWDPNNYDNIDELYMFQKHVWTPTISVYNSVDDLSAIDQDSIPIRVRANGQLEWNPPGILTVSCDTDISHFPFDTQTCGVSVKTFGYGQSQLSLRANTTGIDMRYFTSSGEWTLVHYWTGQDNLDNYDLLTFNFQFERKPEYYGLNLIFPVLVMSLMGLFIFLLPSESGEKMLYSLTVMLTFVVLMSLIGDSIPSTADETSYFEVYVIVVLAMCSVSVFLSILNLNLSFRDEEEAIPPWAIAFTRFMQRVICQTGGQTNYQPRARHSADEPASDRMKSGGSLELRDISAASSRGNDARGQPEVTWKVMATVLEAFFLRVYIVVLVFLTVLFMCLLTVQ